MSYWKSYWHKPTGVSISEVSMLALVAEGAYPRDDFEEARNFGVSSPLSDRSGIIEPQPPSGRRGTMIRRGPAGGLDNETAGG